MLDKEGLEQAIFEALKELKIRTPDFYNYLIEADGVYHAEIEFDNKHKFLNLSSWNLSSRNLYCLVDMVSSAFQNSEIKVTRPPIAIASHLENFGDWYLVEQTPEKSIKIRYSFQLIKQKG